jgi:hypothetical protein
LSVDEKSQIQALDRTQPGLPLKKGRAGTMTRDYKRHGTTTLFAALNVLDGKVIGRIGDSVEFGCKIPRVARRKHGVRAVKIDMHLIIKAKHRPSGDEHDARFGDVPVRNSDPIPKIRKERQCGEKSTARSEG